MAVVPTLPYDPQSQPPPEVVDVVERGLVEIVRRVEIYQSDATTLWNPSAPDDEVARLIDGNVTVDYNSDERRKLDLTLENLDQKLRPNPDGGFWYDKVIKVYRGVRYAADDVISRVAIVEAQGGAQEAQFFTQTLSSLGYVSNEILLTATDAGAVKDNQFIVSLMQDQPTVKSGMLYNLFNQGKTVITIGTGSGMAELPHYSATTSPGSTTYGISPVLTDTPVTGAFVAEAAAPASVGTLPSGTAPGTQALAVWPDAVSPTMVTAALARSSAGGFWLDIHLPNLYGVNSKRLLRAVMNYIKNIEPYKVWETQLGEFYIDGIAAADFPNVTKITARDATKKLINSKLARTSTFEAGYELKDFVIGQAALAGIPVSKMRLNIGNEVTSSEMSFERGTSRWDMIKSALDSFNYERFFDGFGNFVVRKYLDPSTSPVTWTFGTGPKGNLVTFDKAVNDSRIYNHIIVTADPVDEETNPIGYFGEAEVTDVTAPTHKDRIGDRVLPVDAPWLGSNEEASELATERLKVTALESYELNFSSIYYPWLEAGEIVQIDDPDALPIEPDKFLMDSISYPLALGPMSATGKRITFVGSSGGTEA